LYFLCSRLGNRNLVYDSSQPSIAQRYENIGE
jgi:hypothetical protein